MSDNIIKVDFKNDMSGYVIEGESIEGVYNSDLCAVLLNDDKYKCVIGRKGDDHISDGILMTTKEMNDFCLMWLCIFNPSVIK